MPFKYLPTILRPFFSKLSYKFLVLTTILLTYVIIGILGVYYFSYRRTEHIIYNITNRISEDIEQHLRDKTKILRHYLTYEDPEKIFSITSEAPLLIWDSGQQALLRSYNTESFDPVQPHYQRRKFSISPHYYLAILGDTRFLILEHQKENGELFHFFQELEFPFRSSAYGNQDFRVAFLPTDIGFSHFIEITENNTFERYSVLKDFEVGIYFSGNILPYLSDMPNIRIASTLFYTLSFGSILILVTGLFSLKEKEIFAAKFKNILIRNIPDTNISTDRSNLLDVLKTIIQSFHQKQMQLQRTSHNLKTVNSLLLEFKKITSVTELHKSCESLYKALHPLFLRLYYPELDVDLMYPRNILSSIKNTEALAPSSESNFFRDKHAQYVSFKLENKHDDNHGIIYFEFPKNTFIDNEQVEVFSSLAQGLSNSLDRIISLKNKEIQEKNLRFVHYLTSQLHRCKTYSELFSLLYKHLKTFYSQMYFDFFLVDPEENKLVLFNNTNGFKTKPQYKENNAVDAYAQYVHNLQKKQPLLLKNIQENPENIPRPIRAIKDSWNHVLLLPLHYQHHWYGVVKISSSQQNNPFTSFLQNYLQLIASEISTSLHKIKLFEDISNMAREFKTIHYLSQIFNSSLNSSKIIQEVFHHMHKIYPENNFFFLEENPVNIEEAPKLFTFDPDNISLILLDQQENWLDSFQSLKNEKDCVSIPFVEESPYSFMAKNNIKSFVCLPIIHQDKKIGIFLATSNKSHSFSRENIRFFRLIVLHMGIALKNAFLLERIKIVDRQLFHREKMMALGTMSSGVAHDFNNLLASLMGQLEMGASEKNVHKMKQRLQKAISICSESAQLIQRLQTYSRMHDPSDLTPVKLNEILKDTIETMKFRWITQAVNNNIHYSIQTHFDTLPQTYGNEAELKACFTNLIHNALDSMPEGGELVIRSEKKKDTICISFKDTGCGISEAHKQKIFDIFFTTKGEKGSGLGLAEVKKTMERHKGTITVESIPQEGSTFYLTFPIEKRKTKQPLKKKKNSTPLKNLKIMLVDDDPQIVDLITEIVQTAHHIPIPFQNPQKAYTYLESNRPDIIISDIGMPEMDGWEFVQLVRSKYPDIPIIFTTGWAHEQDPQRLEKHNINAVIPKPFKIEEFLDTIYSVMCTLQAETEKEREDKN